VDNRKKILAYLLMRLNDRDAQVRLKCIEELVDLGDPEALDPLERVFKTDTEQSVRNAALAAGRAIFIKQLKAE
jgi:HEAT repeat protein